MLVDAFEKEKGVLDASQLTAARIREQSEWIRASTRSTGQETLLPNLSSSRQSFYSTMGGGVSTQVSQDRTIG
jgi:hypothetical protein